MVTAAVRKGRRRFAYAHRRSVDAKIVFDLRLVFPVNSKSARALRAAPDCNGLFPCQGINYGNQQGDYAGLVSYGGYSYPVWTDSRRQLDAITGCRRALAMEEVFTAKVPAK